MVAIHGASPSGRLTGGVAELDTGRALGESLRTADVVRDLGAVRLFVVTLRPAVEDAGLTAFLAFGGLADGESLAADLVC